MKLEDDPNNPTLLGSGVTEDDFINIARIVKNINKDLIDSGYEHHQARVEKADDRMYILVDNENLH